MPFAVKKSQRYQFAAVGIEPKVKIRSFKTSENALLAPGTELTALHFRAGQHVDVRGTTKGKGNWKTIRHVWSMPLLERRVEMDDSLKWLFTLWVFFWKIWMVILE